MIHHGDLFDVLPTLEADSIDACVTDPPYGLEFMGKEWDRLTGYFAGADNFKGLNLPRQRRRNVRCPECKRLAYDHEPCECGGIVRQRGNEMRGWHQRWVAEVFRVLKPGAYLVAFSGSRTYHHLAGGIESAGFEIRDSLCWLYGQGFPKNYNLGDGKGTALKPAHEPIALAWKPFKGSIKACHAKYGTAALNIDACRIDTNGETWEREPGTVKPNASIGTFQTGARSVVQHDLGRWPANVLLDEEAARLLDEQTGELTSGSGTLNRHTDKFRNTYGAFSGGDEAMHLYGDTGGASRFYYVAKPSREERDFGCWDLPARSGGEATDRVDGSAGLENPRAGAGRTGGARNVHPTVKPVELMRWLVKLVTPPDGVVLDPFCGSGTTGMACRYEHRRFIGIEREAEYVAIAERRIAAVAPLFGEATA